MRNGWDLSISGLANIAGGLDSRHTVGAVLHANTMFKLNTFHHQKELKLWFIFTTIRLNSGLF